MAWRWLFDSEMSSTSRLRGALLGVALGDALGLPFEGLSRRRVARRFRGADRFRLVGRTGFVSDDTEQSALVAQSLASGSDDDDVCLRAFRRSMLGWFARLPFGIGGATLRACLRLAIGLRRTGVSSAGNGAAMRAGILGAHLAHDTARRRRLGRAFATVTHTDERAVQTALYVAEVSALCTSAEPPVNRRVLVARAREVVDHSQLIEAIDRVMDLETRDVSLDYAADDLGNTGFVLRSIALCTFVFLRFGDRPLDAIEAAVSAGGDTDTHAAIVGGWVGALHGEDTWPTRLVEHLHDGPFGPTHLRGLADALVNRRPPPRFSWLAALLRNLALYPVVLAHGLSRLVPR